MSDGGGEGEPAKAAVKDMRVAEIKAELDLRGVKYDDCFEKSDLVARLERSRAYGRADPSIVDKFNKDLLESRLDPELRDMIKNVDKEQLQDMAAADGSLPGGLSPELMDKMMKNPDLMVMLQNPKMQEIMKSVMQDGPSGMAKYMSDPSALELLQKLTAIMQA